MNHCFRGTARFRPLSILCAEDDAAFGQLLADMLAFGGHSVEWVCDGSQAIEKVNGAPDRYDMVITDHHMLRVNGLELVGALREAGYGGVILVQRSALNTVLSRAYSVLGVDAFLTKPYQMPDILAVIQSLFGS